MTSSATAPNFYRVVYISEATDSFSESELEELLEHARVNNRRLGISGILLYEQNFFLQMIEGPARSIISLYATIRKDPRHKNIFTISEGDAVERQFGQWTMAHYKFEPGDSGFEEGYLRIMTSFQSADQLSREAAFVDQYLAQLRDLLPADSAT
ncbi:MAG: BLUF domain-containing protein [Verrucomicrobiota bacterium]